MSLVGRRVIRTNLHTAYHVPGIGQITGVLAEGDLKFSPKMTYTEHGVLALIKGNREILIPFGNLGGMELAPDLQKLVAVPTKK